MRNFALITVALMAVNAALTAASPSVRIFTPENGATFKSNTRGIGVSALAVPGTSPIARVEFYDGTSLKATDTSAPYNFSWRINPSDNGQRVWTARAYDSAGNVFTSAAVVVNVEVDATPPEVAIAASPSSTSITTATALSISARAADNVGVTRVEFVDNGRLQHIVDASPFTYPWRVNAGDNGRHSITARAYDAAGNRSESAPVEFAVNIPTPRDPQLSRTPAAVVLTNGQSHTFQVRNVGRGTLSYTVRTESPWLAISPSGGTSTDAPTLHTITANAAALRAGTNATITVQPDDGREPETITVHVQPPPPTAPAAPGAPRAPSSVRVRL
jgi:hypothetical protein